MPERLVRGPGASPGLGHGAARWLEPPPADAAAVPDRAAEREGARSALEAAAAELQAAAVALAEPLEALDDPVLALRADDLRAGGHGPGPGARRHRGPLAGPADGRWAGHGPRRRPGRRPAGGGRRRPGSPRVADAGRAAGRGAASSCCWRRPTRWWPSAEHAQLRGAGRRADGLQSRSAARRRPIPGPCRLLVGLGVDELSVGVVRVGEVRARVRGLSFEAARAVAGRALDADSAIDVERLLEEAAHAGGQRG